MRSVSMGLQNVQPPKPEKHMGLYCLAGLITISC